MYSMPFTPATSRVIAAEKPKERPRRSIKEGSIGMVIRRAGDR